MILITGGTGFVGRHITARVQEAGHAVRLLSRHPTEMPGVEVARGDVTEIESVAAAAAGCEAVIHLVGIIRESRGQTFTAVHVRGTRNVLQACQQAGISRLLHMSALGARANGRSAYHRSKWAAEELVRASGLAATIFRPSIMFGKGNDFFPRLRQLVTAPTPVIPIVGSGLSLFQPIWVKDTAECFTLALEKSETVGQTYELGGPETYGFEQLVDMVAEVAGVQKPKIHLPFFLARPAITVLSHLPHFPATPEQLTMLLEDNVCDIQPMRQTFGITPASLRDHLTDS